MYHETVPRAYYSYGTANYRLSDIPNVVSKTPYRVTDLAALPPFPTKVGFYRLTEDGWRPTDGLTYRESAHVISVETGTARRFQEGS